MHTINWPVLILAVCYALAVPLTLAVVVIAHYLARANAPVSETVAVPHYRRRALRAGRG